MEVIKSVNHFGHNYLSDEKQKVLFTISYLGMNRLVFLLKEVLIMI